MAVVFDDLSDTLMPEVGADPVSLSSPTAWLPPARIVGLTVIESSAGAFTVNLAVFTCPFNDAVTVAISVMATPEVPTAKDAVVWPPPTVTLAGTATNEELEVSLTVMPAAGVALERVTDPTAFAPPATVLGNTESDASDWAKLHVASRRARIDVVAARATADPKRNVNGRLRGLARSLA